MSAIQQNSRPILFVHIYDGISLLLLWSIKSLLHFLGGDDRMSMPCITYTPSIQYLHSAIYCFLDWATLEEMLQCSIVNTISNFLMYIHKEESCLLLTELCKKQVDGLFLELPSNLCMESFTSYGSYDYGICWKMISYQWGI